MSLKPGSKSRARRLTCLAASACLCLLAHLAAAQSVSAPVQSSDGYSDPTRPEMQPPLNIDRDPIPSPDREEKPIATSTAPAATSVSPGEIQKAQNGMYTLHTDVDEVLLNCSVIDDTGHTVDDLSPGDFRIWEDGVPQTVNSVLHQDIPVSMGILVDNSGSMRDKRAAITLAALKLLKASNPKDAAFVVNFSERAYLDQGFTSDLVSLHRGLARSDSQGTTAMYDAIAASADELVKHAKERKQVLLIITDGADNASRLTLTQAVRRVQNLGGPVVYTIGLLFDVEPGEASRARNALESLSEETGGIAYFPTSLQDLDTIAAAVAHDIRNQYVVDYRSSKLASLGGYRSVRVEAVSSHHGKLFVRTKKGYYAQPPERAQRTQAAKQ